MNESWGIGFLFIILFVLTTTFFYSLLSITNANGGNPVIHEDLNYTIYYNSKTGSKILDLNTNRNIELFEIDNFEYFSKNSVFEKYPVLENNNKNGVDEGVWILKGGGNQGRITYNELKIGRRRNRLVQTNKTEAVLFVKFFASDFDKVDIFIYYKNWKNEFLDYGEIQQNNENGFCTLLIPLGAAKGFEVEGTIWSEEDYLLIEKIQFGVGNLDEWENVKC